ncbi:hypothetical protein Cs7R123_32130 [Catellatospora sp. TT07R-123]|uniref:hypothetical protein n=1 Tax=Catellatospora sp. TT07R-123 TaxID=2733863 RepID=UPI001B1CBFD7|nr:hypothetical protein [Catellatospora sp. TT07R-123]GHJ45871.1 hypothetical protein Cs7R123_32130 [Catellatospora sp. TT07R-123]
MTRLYFSLAQTMVLAEHAMRATDHHLSLTRRDAGLPAVPALLWGKDDGTFLLSSGIPGLPRNAARPDHGQRAVYAEGWGPGTRQELSHTDIGGDDFTEHLELTEPLAIGATLIQYLRAAARRNRPWFALDVSADHIGYAWPTAITTGGQP